jgi:hypothetical protein
MRVNVIWVEKEKRRAMNDTAAAEGVERVRGPPHGYEHLMTYRLGERPSLGSNWT